ncbi:MAG: 6,7-dimethyl-8-ribityllumazine synthase [Verrucomicrobia bacterium]|nr:6,7-dimethyl-8-ribityllumazine synthase [Verrucomicrobiota bacterium]
MPEVDHGICLKPTLAIRMAYDLYGGRMSQDNPSELEINGEDLRVGIAAARFNEAYVDALLENATHSLTQFKAPVPEIIRVPGSNELPYAANLLASSGKLDVVITLGLVLAGETQHHHHIANSTATALHQVSIETGVPVINGIIVVENTEQAEDRCQGSLNRGHEFAKAALEMARLKSQWKTPNQL